MPQHRRAVILAAEDDEDDRLLIELALAHGGPDVDLRFVTDGRELLEYLRREGAWSDPATSPRPDLILLDLNMPRLSGREALRVIKQDGALRSLPVVVWTTSDDARDVRACYEAGANAYVSKPSSIAALSHALSVTTAFWLGVATPYSSPRATDTISGT
jgi:CheY-like chemotaxis protein